MARLQCDQCLRPLKTCFCHLVTKTVNKTKLIILQHPNEVNHAKGSARLLALSLSNCEIIEGENFDNNTRLLALLAQYHNRCALLYPSEDSTELNAPLDISSSLTAIDCLFVLDATWKKSFKMFQVSSILHGLAKVQLPSGFESLYQIRKTKKTDALSTLEASCYALSLLEQNNDNYQPLLTSFTAFNQQHLAFRKSP